MPISRTDSSIIRGPAIITYNGVTFYAKDDIKVKTRLDLFDIQASGIGSIDKRINQVLSEITFTPHGEISSNLLGVLFPHAAAITGASAMPVSDNNLVIQPYNGKERCTYKNAFVSKMPEVSLAATKTPFGQVTFSGFGSNNSAWSTAGRIVDVADNAFSDTGLSSSAVRTMAYTAVLGSLSAPWNNIRTKTGWTVSFDVGMDPVEEDSTGIFDYIYNGQVKVDAKCNPIGIKVADLHALMATFQGTGGARGNSASGNRCNLVLSGATGGINMTLNDMVLDEASHRYGVGDRVEQLALNNIRGLSNGALNALFTIAVAA